MVSRTRSVFTGLAARLGFAAGRALPTLTLLAALAAGAAEVETVTVRFVGADDSAAARGTALGIEEAERQARYFGFHFELDPGAAGASLVISAQRDSSALHALVSPDRLVVNALDPTREGCRKGLFHVVASEAMQSAALAQWRTTREGDLPAVELWHPSLVKYAARDLNKRYREKFGEPMTSEAWAGWAAARSLGEAVLRTKGQDPVALAYYFLTDFGFDGQKGSALTFRPNRQLRQPLYYVSAEGEVVGEAPLKEAVADRSLDSLGETECVAGPKG